MATFLKTPPVHLIMILVALGVTFAKPKCNTLLLLGTVAAVYIVVSRHTGFTNHVRYAAIAIPLLYLTGTARVSAAAIWVRRVTAIVVVVEAVSVAMWAPAFLSYRGPQEVCVGGIEHAIGMSDFDSTVDWGQHLLLLRTWLNRHPEYVLVGLAHNHRASVVEAAGLPTKYPPRHHTPPIPQSRFGHQTPVVALNIRALYTPTDEYLHFRARTPLTVIAGTIFVYELQTDEEGGTK